MKSVIYSIVAALILSVLFALFVPRLLFKGDAHWTYENDAARVDVKFSGHLKKGRVDARGTDLQILQPEWLSNKNYQGTVALVPVSYRDKRCQIKLTPRAEEWGEDATLVIELKGRDFRHQGTRRPAWVCFRNITLNGQRKAEEKVVWLNKPFVLRYPLHSSRGITLAFDVCKPFATSDISSKNLLGIFSACLVLCLLFTYPKATECHIPEFMYRKDVIRVISDGYLHIDPVYRRSFWIIFGVLCFAFGFHTVCFMWGNHDWVLLNSNQPWLSYAWCGRYMINAVKIPLSNGIYLPLIHDLIIFITLAFNAILLCKYWRLEKRVIYYVLCGLVLTVQPFTLCMIYYVHMTPEVFIAVTCTLTALLLSEKTATGGGYITLKIVYGLLSVALINFALGVYPVLLNTIAVAFAGRLLVQSFDWDGSMQRLKLWVKPVVISTINIVLGIASYKLVVTYVFPLKPHGFNTDTLPLERVPERLGILFKQCFRQLWEYSYPFTSQRILWIFLGFTLVLALYICFTGNIKQKVARLFLLFVSLFATQTTMIVAKSHVIDGRIELFGLVFFDALVVALTITQLRKLRNLWIVAGTCVIFVSVLKDLDCLRVWKLGFDAEKMLWNRTLARIETQKEFNPMKKYDFVLIGRPIPMRPRYYTGAWEKFHGDALALLTFSYDLPGFPCRAYEFYYPTRFRRRGFSSSHKNKPDYINRLRRLYRAGVLQKAGVWPKQNGLIVWKDIILIVTDGKELNNVKKRFERELGKK